MTSIQLIELLKREIKDCQVPDSSGHYKSVLGALELVDEFKKQIQDETINDFLSIYKTLVPDHDARHITAHQVARKYENSKNPLVKCR